MRFAALIAVTSAGRIFILIKEATMLPYVTRRFLGIWLLPFVTVLDVHAQEPRVTDTDIDFLLASIHQIHPDPYRLFSAAAFDSVAAALKEQLSSWSSERAALETQRLLAMVGDGHTEWETIPVSLRGRWLPLIFRRFEEGWFVRTGDPTYSQLFGKPITRTILRFQVADSLAGSFGTPMTRWFRPNQLQAPAWPTLLEPAARPLDWSERGPEMTVEACTF